MLMAVACPSDHRAKRRIGVALTAPARGVFPGPMKPDASVRGAPSGRERQLKRPCSPSDDYSVIGKRGLPWLQAADCGPARNL